MYQSYDRCLHITPLPVVLADPASHLSACLLLAMKTAGSFKAKYNRSVLLEAYQLLSTRSLDARGIIVAMDKLCDTENKLFQDMLCDVYVPDIMSLLSMDSVSYWMRGRMEGGGGGENTEYTEQHTKRIMAVLQDLRAGMFELCIIVLKAGSCVLPIHTATHPPHPQAPLHADTGTSSCLLTYGDVWASLPCDLWQVGGLLLMCLLRDYCDQTGRYHRDSSGDGYEPMDNFSEEGGHYWQFHSMIINHMKHRPSAVFTVVYQSMLQGHGGSCGVHDDTHHSKPLLLGLYTSSAVSWVVHVLIWTLGHLPDTSGFQRLLCLVSPPSSPPGNHGYSGSNRKTHGDINIFTTFPWTFFLSEVSSLYFSWTDTLNEKDSKPPHGQIQPPHGQTQQVNGQIQSPYGQTQPPYGQTQPPYGQTQPPYGQTQPPFSGFVQSPSARPSPPPPPPPTDAPPPPPPLPCRAAQMSIQLVEVFVLRLYHAPPFPPHQNYQNSTGMIKMSPCVHVVHGYATTPSTSTKKLSTRVACLTRICPFASSIP